MPFSFRSLTVLQYLRIAQVVLAIVCLGLAAETVSVSSNDAGYLIFVSVWTFLALAFLVFAPIYWTRGIFHRLAPLGVELLTNVFWFTAFIVMAAIYGPGSCSWYRDYNDNNYYPRYYPYYSYRSSRYKTACQTSKAAIAFAAINWLLFIFTTVLMTAALFGLRFSRTHAAAGPSDVESATPGVQTDAALGEKATGEDAPVGETAVPAYSAPTETPAVADATVVSEKPV
ncbi:membrane-associating domain-containing protein [Lipomyces chichibuensis]|uniref:membrane-associating domain-containing protein n=1 Tax=Lipomyces chichibuensis TaxID=1546026 RepID=UPI003344369C